MPKEASAKQPKATKQWDSKQTPEEQELMVRLVVLQDDLFRAGLIQTSLHIQETQRVAGRELADAIRKREG